ncbi:MAG TPA: protein-L-isoaspartate(D-aspartate) O-methyltransferase [Thermoanaerobaculia bacterium]|nr:protein-L-isoaspartate(D-aspartate) O-methyltransferase [Thermoanaerobaculia bacterium]
MYRRLTHAGGGERLAGPGRAGRGLRIAAGALLLVLGCGTQPAEPADEQTRRRMRMVDEQIRARGVRDERVLEVMRRVPRHEFVPPAQAVNAYQDSPLPIGLGQTISQPYIVAYMTEQLQVTPRSKVLEIGTGSGYQAAVLAELVEEVYTIEIVPELAQRSKETLERLGYQNVHVRAGDGYRGWPEAAPFDRIIVTAAPNHIPQPLVDQLAVGGRMIIPVGEHYQRMTILTRTPQGVVQQKTIDVVFVPMTGEAQKKQ